jgi:23S rRNA pseudouridine2457 synthase
MPASRTIAFYKPYAVLCQFTDAAGRRTLRDYIDLPGIYSAGRLDYHSEGLLLLSNDGGLLHYLTDPGFEHPKTYLAQVEGVVTTAALEKLRKEIVLPGVQSKLVNAEIIPEPDIPPRPVPVRGYHATTWLSLVLCEGKKHQVRRMTAAVGFPTLRLVRIAIGEITLSGLSPGEWRMLMSAELRALRSPMPARQGRV